VNPSGVKGKKSLLWHLCCVSVLCLIAFSARLLM
jgi:hypothetical protein